MRFPDFTKVPSIFSLRPEPDLEADGYGSVKKYRESINTLREAFAANKITSATLTGKSGFGKTTLMYAIRRAALEVAAEDHKNPFGAPNYFISSVVSEAEWVSNRRRHENSQPSNTFIDMMSSENLRLCSDAWERSEAERAREIYGMTKRTYAYLFMDELGSEPSDTTFSRRSLEEFFDGAYRFRHFTSLVVATNLSEHEVLMKLGEHIWRRLFGESHTCVIAFDGQQDTPELEQARQQARQTSKKEKIAEASDKEIDKLFEGGL